MSLPERYKVLPIQKTDMEDLPLKKPVQPQKGTATRKRRSSPSTKAKRAVKPLPKQEQPRDTLGRFARKTGQVLWGAAKGTVKAVKGTVKAVKKAHRAVKRVRAGYRQRASLALRERKITLLERERKAGMKRKKSRRRKRS